MAPDLQAILLPYLRGPYLSLSFVDGIYQEFVVFVYGCTGESEVMIVMVDCFVFCSAF